MVKRLAVNLFLTQVDIILFLQGLVNTAKKIGFLIIKHMCIKGLIVILQLKEKMHGD